MLEAVAARPEVSDETLRRAQAGDSAAFADILLEHQGMVFSLAYHFLGDPSRAEELAQEVFLKLYRHLPRLDSAAHVVFWLRRVTTHGCIDWFRRNQRRPDQAVETLPEPSVPPASRDVLLEGRLRRLVAELPERARLVVTLRYQEDLDLGEIAAILDMPVNTVKSHLRRSVNVLRARLGEPGGPR